MHGTYLDTHRRWENYFHCFLSIVWAFQKGKLFSSWVRLFYNIGICVFLSLASQSWTVRNNRQTSVLCFLTFCYSPWRLFFRVLICAISALFLACVQTITKLWLVNQSLISSARRLRFLLWSVKTSSLAKYDYVDYFEIFMLLVGKKKLWKQRGIWVWIRAFDHTRARSWM